MTQFSDDRGLLINVLKLPINSVVVITSTAGSVRAEHYHKTTNHWCYVMSGAIDYRERPVGSKEKPTLTRYTAGQRFFTGPGLEHSMAFPEDTVFLTLSNNPRSQEEYEADLVRLTEKLHTL
jgi:quercetin dioxygenase-like cupin family protein